jgi:hypothetical protein
MSYAGIQKRKGQPKKLGTMSTSASDHLQQQCLPKSLTPGTLTPFHESEVGDRSESVQSEEMSGTSATLEPYSLSIENSVK